VTNDNSPQPVETPDATAAPAAEAVETSAARKRPARRRVTRTVASTQAAEPATETAAAPATEETSTVDPQPSAVVDPQPEPGTGDELAGSPTQTPPGTGPARPARRSRRVTRTVVVGQASGAGQAETTPEPVAPTPEPVAPALEEVVPPEAVPEPDAPERGAEPPMPAMDEDADEAASVAPDPATEPAEPLDVLAELGGLRPAQPARSGRLASTALLFQPPEPTARSRRRRVQSDAGSPQQVSATAHPVQGEETDQQIAAPVEEPVQASAGTGRSGRRRGRGRSAEAAVVDLLEDSTAEPADEVEPEQPAEGTVESEQDATGEGAARRRRRRGGRGRRSRSEATTVEGSEDESAPSAESTGQPEDDAEGEGEGGSGRRRRRRRRGGRGENEDQPRSDEVTALRGSTRLEAKRQRRRDGRDAGRRRQIISEAEFLARRESVDRVMVVRERGGRTQIAVLEDGVLVEHYVSNQAAASMVGNVYLGRVQNVLPSMEAAFVDVGKGRNAVLYAGEVNWDAAGLDGQPRRIEQALKSGDQVLVQVTKDPIGHKGARLTSQVTLAGRYLVLVPGGGMTGISHKLPDIERNRLKKILRAVVPDATGVIVRTAAEGASEEELSADIARLQAQWEAISAKAKTASAPALLQGEPDMAIRVVRDIFNDDFTSLVVAGEEAWATISSYIGELAPDLAAKVTRWTGDQDVFGKYRVDEQLAKGMDRKVWLPSGGSLVIDRTEAMTVVDVNTGKFTGAGGTLEETVTRNNLEAAEEIVRQLRLRDIGGMIVVDFIDMVLVSNRDLVLRRLVECLGRDRTKHQVAEVTSLGLVQMTRKRVGQGLVEAFSETCEHCHGRGFIVHTEPVEKNGRPEAGGQAAPGPEPTSKRSRRKKASAEPVAVPAVPVLPEAREAVKATLATIAAAAAHAHEHHEDGVDGPDELGAPPVALVDQLFAEPAEPVGSGAAQAEPAVVQEVPTETPTETPTGDDGDHPVQV
jgi:ribonuclease E